MTFANSSNNPIYCVRDNRITNDFPDIESALENPDGLLAIGGDLAPERLIDAYTKGIFPWYSEGQPIMWWAPSPRWVIKPEELKISRSLRKLMKKNRYQVTFNQAFNRVIDACAEDRNNHAGTWITYEIQTSYKQLHEMGYAHSVECWDEDKLVGGLYGITIGKVFFGESMFSRVSNTSKIAMVNLCALLKNWHFPLIDCQIHSLHVETLGACSVSRSDFRLILEKYCDRTLRHEWPVSLTII